MELWRALKGRKCVIKERGPVAVKDVPTLFEGDERIGFLVCGEGLGYFWGCVCRDAESCIVMGHLILAWIKGVGVPDYARVNWDWVRLWEGVG